MTSPCQNPDVCRMPRQLRQPSNVCCSLLLPSPPCNPDIISQKCLTQETEQTIVWVEVYIVPDAWSLRRIGILILSNGVEHTRRWRIRIAISNSINHPPFGTALDSKLAIPLCCRAVNYPGQMIPSWPRNSETYRHARFRDTWRPKWPSSGEPTRVKSLGFLIAGSYSPSSVISSA